MNIQMCFYRKEEKML